MIAAAVVFVVCLVFWVLLSGQLDAFHLLLGAASAAAVTALNRDVEGVSEAVRRAPRFLAYLPWLLREIVKANLQVVRIVLDPRLPIDPVVVRLRVRLSSDLAVTTLGNSITLTPGTITLEVEGAELVVHALTRAGGDDILGGAMARRVGRVFGDPGQ